MGIAPLPTPAQAQNQKSGLALERISTQEAIGAFHFTDNFSRFLQNFGRQTNELITELAKLNSLPKQLLGKDQKDEDMQLNVAPRTQNENPESEHLEEANLFFAHRGQFEVAVSEGPFHESEREEASEFADLLLQTAPSLGFPPPLIQQLLSMAVKLKNIGIYGDEIADLLAPPNPQNLSPQAQAILRPIARPDSETHAGIAGFASRKARKEVGRRQQGSPCRDGPCFNDGRGR